MDPLVCVLAIFLATSLLPGVAPRAEDGQRVEAVITHGTEAGQFLAVVGGVRRAEGGFEPFTDVRFRAAGGRADQWDRYARFDSSILALAQRGEDLAILLELNDNQTTRTELRFVFNPLEPRRGAVDVPVPPVPAGVSLMDIAGGARDTPLYALSSQDGAASAWSLTGVQWEQLPDLPAALAELRRPGLDLGSVGGRPVIAGRVAPEAVAVYVLMDGQWRELGTASLEPEDLFEVIDAEAGAVMLYVYGETDQVVQFSAPAELGEDRPLPPRVVAVEFRLPERVAAVPQAHDPRSAAVALGSVRLVRASRNDPSAARRDQFLLEVALDPVTLDLVGDGQAASLRFPTVTPEEYRRLMYELLLYALLIVTLVVLFRQRPVAAGEHFQEAGTEIAPMPLRAAAGLIDLVPLLLTAAVWYVTSEGLGETGRWVLVGAGVLVYLAHLTVAEALTGRSLGKAMFGLKVVSTTGGMPNLTSVLVRNLLRPLDAPAAGLGMALLSPLRQRLGDLAAGTTVVRILAPPEP